MKKFELTSEVKVLFFGRKLFRIRALIDFGFVKAGEVGGWVEKEENLSHDGNAWVYGNAEVYGDARVYGDAWVYGNAEVYGNARVCDNADYTTIRGFGRVCRPTTFFRCKDKKIRVVCGCFFGTIPEFRDKVCETHGDSKLAKEYLMIADLMDYHFSSEEDK